MRAFFRHIILATALGVAAFLLYGYWQGIDNQTLLSFVWKGFLVGLIVGVVLEIYKAIYELSPKPLEKRQNIVIYRPISCARCKGKGGKRLFFIFPLKCKACGGRGSILVAEKSEKCSWCGGSGKWTIFRIPCRICSGTGWAHSSIDEL